jgi:hypothetical protein
MSAKSVDKIRAAYESWNRRDFRGVIRDSVEGLVYTDHSRNLTMNTRHKIREWSEARPGLFPRGEL